MKTRFFILSMALAAAAMVACTDKLSDELLWDEGVMAALPEFEEEGSGTRVSFSNGLANFAWSNGDCIGVCRSSASSNGTAAFTLLKGGERVGNFINDSFSLLPQTEYYAFYPFKTGTTASVFSMDMAYQSQVGNNSLNHIGDFNYMSAKFTTDDNGKASFTFSNIGAIIQVHFTADKEDTYKNITITSNGAPFTIRATYNLSTETITPTYPLETFRISFGEDGMHVYNGEDVTVSAVILPVDMSQSTLTFTIKNAEGVAKEFSLAGFAFTKGKLYHFYEDDSRGDPPYGGCPDGNHPHAIDLGLPSGTLWSCMNLGADVPIDRGISFAWGQTDFVEKNSSTWANYEFMNESYNDEWGINKYQIDDKKTNGCWYDDEDNYIGDNKVTLDLMDDDAAWKNWGNGWRMPSKKECEELINYSRFEAITYGQYHSIGRCIYKKKPNGQYSLWDTYILLPFGDYWTASLGATTKTAAIMKLSSTGTWSAALNMNASDRINKHLIRPVRSKGNGDSGSQSGGRP